jgi:hypothetical protein
MGLQLYVGADSSAMGLQLYVGADSSAMGLPASPLRWLFAAEAAPTFTY